MRKILGAIAVLPALLALLLAGPTNAIEFDPLWYAICHTGGGAPLQLASTLPDGGTNQYVPPCAPAPTAFQELPVQGNATDTSITLRIGYDIDTSRLCFINGGANEAPTIRVGVGHTLTIHLTNTLRDTGIHHIQNCAIENFGGENICLPKPTFAEAPGTYGPWYPLMANEAHMADGTVNLHVHGLFVTPQPCSDEVILSTIYPVNWGGGVAGLQPCQTAPSELTYTYDIPADHPTGAYWYHTHRHGEAEMESQMGLVGAIIIEDSGDIYRRQTLGVTDEVLLINDYPLPACIVSGGAQCDGPNQPASIPAPYTVRQPNQAAARAAARAALAAGTLNNGTLNNGTMTAAANSTTSAAPTLDPRIDQVDQAGECAQGAQGVAGGVQLWTLKLNGTPVIDGADGSFPPDSEILQKTMQPGQRQIFRIVNAASDSFIAPELILSQNGTLTTLPLEVWARDGVGLTDAGGNRHIGIFDTTTNPIIVPPAGRIELVVHAPPAGANLYLQSAQVNPGCGGNAYPARRLLEISTAGAAVNPGAADDSDLLTNLTPLRRYINSLNNPVSVYRTIVFSEYGRDFTYGVTQWNSGPPTPYDYNAGLTDFYVTQVYASDGSVNPATTSLRPFGSNTLTPDVTVHLHGQQSVTEEWLVENSTLEIHAFHMHQIHFRDVTLNTTNPDLQPVLDTAVLPAAPLMGNTTTGMPGAPGYLRLRMTFTTQDIGEFVFHCHILEHEDSGMMAKIKVVAD